MAQTFDINMTEVIGFTNKLSKLHKSALPLAIRSTLNDAAFEAKKVLPLVWDKNFTVRKMSFIKSHARVNKSPNTFNIKSMVSEIGILKGKSKAGNRLAFQEVGGIIESHFMPRDVARDGSTRSGKISKRAYFQRNNIRKANNKQQFIKMAYMNAKSNKSDLIWYKDLVFNVDSFSSSGGQLDIKYDVLYSTKESKVSIEGRGFIRKSAKLAIPKMPTFYRKNAEFRIKKEMMKYMK
jgi:hypothetical protein